MENGFDQKTEKWWESKITFLIATLTPFVFIVWFIAGIRMDIALIQQSISNINSNHEAHIQDILEQIKDMKTIEINQAGQIIELQKQVLVIVNTKDFLNK